MLKITVTGDRSQDAMRTVAGRLGAPKYRQS
jgi:hypothetical protein